MKGQVLFESLAAIALVVTLTFLCGLLWMETKKNLNDSQRTSAQSRDGHKEQTFKEELKNITDRMSLEFKTTQINRKSYLFIKESGVKICFKSCGKNLEDLIKKN